MMIDMAARVRLRDTIELLIANKLTWDKYDEYCKSLKTEDESVHDIAWLLWELTDPEYPENQKCLTKDMLANIHTFLSSDFEYAGRPQARPSGIISRVVNRIMPLSLMHVIDSKEFCQESWPFANKEVLSQRETNQPSLNPNKASQDSSAGQEGTTEAKTEDGKDKK